MNAGKDPFPRDEVTGLAAFDHLEPVKSLSVVPERSMETPVLTRDALPEDLGPDAASANDSEQSWHSEEPISGRRPRPDATLPLDLTALRTAELTSDHARAFSDESAPYEPTADNALSAPVTVAHSDLDSMFDDSSGMGWDEDEATRVHTQSHASDGQDVAAQDPEGDAAASDIEWDEEEPPTQMRPFAMFDAPPIAERHEPSGDWPEWRQVEEDETSKYLASAVAPRPSATPTIRATTPPAHLLVPSPAPEGNGPEGRDVTGPEAIGPEGNGHAGVGHAGAVNGQRPGALPTAPLLGLHADDEAHQEQQERDELAPGEPLQFSRFPQAAQPALTQTAQGIQPVPPPEAELSAFLPATRVTPASFLEALKSGDRRSRAIAGSAAVGLVVLALVLRAISSGPSVGSATVEVSPADAKILVDGQPVDGTGSPYSLSDLAPGSHQLAVKKAGFSDYSGSFSVRAGESTSVPVVELAAAARDVGFTVRSAPTGASIWIDGASTAQVTPARLTGIAPGIHRLTLKHEGYSDYDLQLFVPEGTVLQLPAAELLALPAQEEAEPDRGRRRSRSRAQSADDEDTSSPARSRGRYSTRDDADSDSAASASRSSGRRSRSPSSSKDSAGSDLAGPSRTGSADKTGTLRLNTRPWSEVIVDGRVVGNTPQPNLQLSAGRHKLQLVNQPLGLSKTLTVTVKTGETVTKVINLAE